jgi:hypothetical protein
MVKQAMTVKSFWESNADELDRLDIEVLGEVMNGAMYDTDTGLLIEDD